MVHPSSAEQSALLRVAREMRETADELGYHVGVAVREHETFSHTRGPASAMERNLIMDAARRGAAGAGLPVAPASGGGLDIVTMSPDTLRRYRVRSVKLDTEGNYKVMCSAGSSLITVDEDEASLLRIEKWVLGYVVSDDHTIDHLMAGRIVDWYGDGPVYLVLRDIIDLSGSSAPPPSFTSTEEGLEGFNDEGNEEDGEAGGF